MLVVREKTAKNLFIEMANRLDLVEVKGDSVEHLFRIKMALKKIVESIEELPDQNKEAREEEE